MRCTKCGYDNQIESRFCGSCGSLLQQTNPQNNNENMNNTNQQVSNNTNPQSNMNHQQNINRPVTPPPRIHRAKPSKTVLGIISIILGVVSLIVALIINIFAIPIPIIGIVLGAMAIKKGKKGQGVVGIVLNVLGLIAIVLIFVFTVWLVSAIKDYSFIGSFDCIGYPSNVTDMNEINELLENPSTHYEFNMDGTFLAELYDIGDPTNKSVIKGTYAIVDSETENDTMEYIVNLTTNYRNIGGEVYTDEYTTQYSLAYDINNPKEYVMINTVSYSMYYCRKK